MCWVRLNRDAGIQYRLYNYVFDNNKWRLHTLRRSGLRKLYCLRFEPDSFGLLAEPGLGVPGSAEPQLGMTLPGTHFE